MVSEVILIGGRNDETIWTEPGRFTPAGEGKRIPVHLSRLFRSLKREWKHKSDLYPGSNPELTIKYLHRLGKLIPGVYESDGAGNYRLNPHKQIFEAV